MFCMYDILPFCYYCEMPPWLDLEKHSYREGYIFSFCFIAGIWSTMQCRYIWWKGICWRTELRKTGVLFDYPQILVWSHKHTNKIVSLKVTRNKTFSSFWMKQKEEINVFQLCILAFQRFLKTPGKLKQMKSMSCIFSEGMLYYLTHITNDIKGEPGQISFGSCFRYPTSRRDIH